MTAETTPDRFAEVYSRDDVTYGDVPSPELRHFLRQSPPGGRALDLGAGLGRDTLAIAAAGYQVTAIDRCQEGVARLRERAAAMGVASRIETCIADAREATWQSGRFDLIVATTILDHLPAAAAPRVWQRMLDGLSPGGWLSVEVHTTDDPGSDVGYGARSDAPVSETADQVLNYFAPGTLLHWAAAADGLRVIRYEERLEWDYTHGPPHQHGKAILLACRADVAPRWYGAPPAFPERPRGKAATD